MDPLLAQLTHRPFPEVAEILRDSAVRISVDWQAAILQAMPQMQHLTFDELNESTPQILLAISHALASEDANMIRELVKCAPTHGLLRFKLNFDVVDLMQEDRLLRAITVLQIESGLGRRMEVPESAALHAAIDVMIKGSVIALVDQQKAELRTAAERELKFLSFIAHDLNNNLNNVTMTLESVGMDIRATGRFADAEESLDRARQCIHDTVIGMRRMLDHERLRKSGDALKLSPVDLHALATKILGQFSREADIKGAQLIVEMLPGTVVESDGELLTLVLQNLVGNAVKYITRGAIRVGFEEDVKSGDPVLYVLDDGPGIEPALLKTVFEAFRRGEVHGQPGVGLGLTIASQAAKLLGGSLTVDSQVGVGSNFRLLFRRVVDVPLILQHTSLKNLPMSA